MNVFLLLTLCPLIAEMSHPSAIEIDSAKVDWPIAVAVSAVTPLNTREPVIVVKYCNQGKSPFRIDLPGKKWEIQRCRSVALKIDDKKAQTVVDPTILRLADIILTRRVDIGPGETAELELPLTWMFKIPKDWQKLEVQPLHGSAPGKIKGTLILER